MVRVPAWYAAVCGFAFAGAAYAQPAGSGSGPIAAAVARHAGDIDPAGPTSTTPNQADADTAAWSEATRALLPGAEVRLILANGRSVHGVFRAADDRRLGVAVDGADQRVNRADVVRLSVRQGTLRKRRESIGMAIGGAIGASIWLRRCGRTRDSCHEEAMLYFGGPIMAGGLVGHTLPEGTAWRDVYRRR